MRNGFEDLELDELWRRRSAKWQKCPPGVLPAASARRSRGSPTPARAVDPGRVHLIRT